MHMSPSLPPASPLGPLWDTQPQRLDTSRDQASAPHPIPIQLLPHSHSLNPLKGC